MYQLLLMVLSSALSIAKQAFMRETHDSPASCYSCAPLAAAFKLAVLLSTGNKQEWRIYCAFLRPEM